jgi:molecular chaperone DnaK (HSP70)
MRFIIILSGATVANIGIDLGTTNICVASSVGGKPEIIQSSFGDRTTPSIVAFLPDGETQAGHRAKRTQVLMPEATISGWKRLIGRRFNRGALMKFQPSFAYGLCTDSAGLIAASSHGVTTSMTEVAGLLLAECVQSAESHLAEEVENAVITVPAYFNELQRSCIRKAARFTGLPNVRLITEPVAAALAYGLRKGDGGRVLVFDLGGATLDVALIRISAKGLSVESIGGNNLLGGMDFDHALVQLITEQLEEQCDLSWRDGELQWIAQQASLLKHKLSSCSSGKVEAICGGQPFTVEITRSQFERAVEPLVARCMKIVERTLEHARIKWDSVQSVLLVGGQTRMPLIRNRLEELTGTIPSKTVNPDEAVAMGAALLANQASGVQISDVLPMSLRMMIGQQMQVVVAKGTQLPHKRLIKIKVPSSTYAFRAFLFHGENEQPTVEDSLGCIIIDELGSDGDTEVHLDLLLDKEGIMACRVRVPDIDPNGRFVELHTNTDWRKPARKRRPSEARRRANAH